MSGKSPETTYIIYAGAISSDNVKVEKNISITTKEKVLTTADEYVDEYAKLATEVTEEQKGYLKTFVGTLISSKLWDKVRCCFPMLGGLSGYNKDLKDVHNQRSGIFHLQEYPGMIQEMRLFCLCPDWQKEENQFISMI